MKFAIVIFVYNFETFCSCNIFSVSWYLLVLLVSTNYFIIQLYINILLLLLLLLIETFDMLRLQETLYFEYTNLGSHVQFQIRKSNGSCRQGRMGELTLLHKCFPGLDWYVFVF